MHITSSAITLIYLLSPDALLKGDYSNVYCVSVPNWFPDDNL
ncbi:hypothetical protein BAZSYMA_ACONTIG255105_0 [Bathymodiolus azoricus thioautotrophic gill symbiont]|uniref:Uncharacterized protein n=1 Tax=Bathymodiolus azoricus thioautotrophic gill symbiont TaxID=235205 RepID=A0A1H6M6T4_9GAMM|nr:hypothetical protein BAZSYMA_ACONTIG255105_0 [Bathymodiolus azoricus thioautotrophic gill symbiont]